VAYPSLVFGDPSTRFARLLIGFGLKPMCEIAFMVVVQGTVELEILGTRDSSGGLELAVWHNGTHLGPDAVRFGYFVLDC
jgi:hypothetical protein